MVQKADEQGGPQYRERTAAAEDLVRGGGGGRGGGLALRCAVEANGAAQCLSTNSGFGI